MCFYDNTIEYPYYPSMILKDIVQLEVFHFQNQIQTDPMG